MSMTSQKAANKITSSVLVNKSTKEKKTNYNPKEVRKKIRRKKKERKMVQKIDRTNRKHIASGEFKHNYVNLNKNVVRSIYSS